MSKITIVEAAKQFNVTRPRIYRSIRKGEITTTLREDGVQLIQVQDMVRLFDNVKKKPVQNNVRKPVSDTDSKLVQLLEEQLKKAEEDKAFLKQQINDLRKDFDDYKLRLEHHPKVEQPTDVTSNDQLQTPETLQIEQEEKTVKEQPDFELKDQQEQPIKKGLLRRLVSEMLR